MNPVYLCFGGAEESTSFSAYRGGNYIDVSGKKCVNRKAYVKCTFYIGIV